MRVNKISKTLRIARSENFNNEIRDQRSNYNTRKFVTTYLLRITQSKETTAYYDNVRPFRKQTEGQRRATNSVLRIQDLYSWVETKEDKERYFKRP